MSKDIWHKPPQTPDVFKSHPIIVVYEAGDQIEQMDSKEYSDLVGERYVNRWCYVDDLIKENERTRKALDVALDWLGQVATPAKCDDDLCREFTKRKLAEIKTAQEQKDN